MADVPGRGNGALRKLLLWLLHTVLPLVTIIRGIELALGGGDESIGSNLPTLEAANANPMPGSSRPGDRSDRILEVLASWRAPLS
jgi:hypothetical protein